MVSGCRAYAGTPIKSGAAAPSCPSLPPSLALRTRRSQVRVLQGAPNQQLTGTRFGPAVHFVQFVLKMPPAWLRSEPIQTKIGLNSGERLGRSGEHLVENQLLTRRHEGQFAVGTKARLPPNGSTGGGSRIANVPADSGLGDVTRVRGVRPLLTRV